MESWEKQAIENRDIINESKLLKKYGGLRWMDPDHGNMLLYADKKALHWTRVNKKTGGGYCVNAVGPGYIENDPDNHKHVEPWLIGETLVTEIAHFYRTNPNEGVVVEDLVDIDINNDDDDDDDDNDDDNDDDDMD